jgi:hypothetical protein
LDNAGPGAPELDLRYRLRGLYAELAEATAAECAGACERPHSCCAATYCHFAMEFAERNWGVVLSPTGHGRLPLMGATGCIALPHLRPLCTAHTCAVSQFGGKPGDDDWTERYFALQEAIAEIETALFGSGMLVPSPA